MTEKIAVWKLQPDQTEILLPLQNQSGWQTMDDINRSFPESAYTTFRTYQHWYCSNLSHHFDRLEETSHLANRTVQLDRDLIRKAIKIILEEQKNIPEIRIRIILDMQKKSREVYFVTEPLSIPNQMDYQKGVCVLSKRMHRNNPKAKLTQFLVSSQKVRNELKPGFNEVLMIGEDEQILEGLSSNFFAVKDGKIWTEEENVLSGITRSLVLETATELGIPVIRQGILVDELRYVKEAFITSVSRSILPIREIEQLWTARSVPGAITQKLMQRFDQKLQDSLEKL